VTEVPEHLLRRSQERRSALGGDGGGGAPEASSGGGAGEASNVPARTAAADAPAAAAIVEVEEPVAPPAPYVQAALRRPRVPRFAVPVLAALPLWALLYAGTLYQPAEKLDPIVAHGQTLYTANCSGCHGNAGQGGTGRPLNGGSVLETFPNIADHLAWVHTGSQDIAAGTPYGNPARPGGQHVSQTGGFGPMPAFRGKLSDDDILAIVRYERQAFGDQTPEENTAEADQYASGGGGSDVNQAKSGGGNVGSSTTQPSSSNKTSTNPQTQK
jgi:mono/diheme cytochrome c family protein